MTSVAVSAILFILSFVVLMVLVMKGVNLIPAAIIGSLILSFAVEGGPVNALLTLFSGGAGGYCTNLFNRGYRDWARSHRDFYERFGRLHRLWTESTVSQRCHRLREP